MNQCPECKGNRVTTVNENMLCLTCGFQEYLYDFENAYDLHITKEPEKKPEPLAIQKVVHYHRHISVKKKRTNRFT